MSPSLQNYFSQLGGSSFRLVSDHACLPSQWRPDRDALPLTHPQQPTQCLNRRSFCKKLPSDRKDITSTPDTRMGSHRWDAATSPCHRRETPQSSFVDSGLVLPTRCISPKLSTPSSRKGAWSNIVNNSPTTVKNQCVNSGRRAQS
jgi:hypothetical protein